MRTTLKPLLSFLLVLFLAVPFLAESAPPTTFSKVKVRFSKDDDRRMVDKDIDLVFDDGARKLIARGEYKPLEVAYGDIQKIVFDVSAHMRGGGMSQVIGGLVGAAMAAKHVHDYWCLVEYKSADGATRTYLMEIDKESSDEVVEKMKALFPDKVSVTEFKEFPEDVKKEELKDLQSKHDDKADKRNHPMPEAKPDQALVVAVCPSLAARYAGAGIQFKMHANDKVIAVNKWGTYSFAYLDPGDYLIASQTENVVGVKLKLEAGKEYYFFQNTFMGTWKAKTGISRVSKERALAEIDGSYWSDWKRK